MTKEEQKEFLKNYIKSGSISLRPAGTLQDDLSEYHEDLTGSDEPLDSARVLFERIVKTALDNRKDSAATIKELDALRAENKQLKEALKLSEQNLHEIKENSSETSQNVEILQIEHSKALELADENQKRSSEKSEIIADLEQKLSILNQQVESRVKLTDNQFIVTGNDFFIELLKDYLESEKVKNYFTRANKGGMLNGFVDSIDSDNWRDNAQNLIKNVFVSSACGYMLFELKTRKQIKQLFDNSIKTPANV